MKETLIFVIVQYVVLSVVFGSFALLLAQRPTPRVFVVYGLLWPRQVVRGLRRFVRSLGQMDIR
jgi:hypothetical protein